MKGRGEGRHYSVIRRGEGRKGRYYRVKGTGEEKREEGREGIGVKGRGGRRGRNEGREGNAR